MLIKKSKIGYSIMAIAMLAIVSFSSCNNEGEKKEEPAADTTKTEAPAPVTAPADTTTAPADTASTRPIKNPG
jgi:hypothetical protein